MAIEVLAEREAAEELEAEVKDDERMTITSAAPPDKEEARRFLEKVEEREAALKDRSEEKMDDLDMPEEREVGRFFERTFYEGYWLWRTGQFPDGRPLIHQDRRRAAFWTIWINAMDVLTSHGVA